MKWFQTFKEYCNTATAHGVGYFFSDFPAIIRLLWVIITLVMMTASLIWVSNVTTEWARNPTALVHTVKLYSAV